MDCGCAPGSWSQVAAKMINSKGKFGTDTLAGLLIGCDLLPVEPVKGAILLPGKDFTEPNVQALIKDLVKSRPFDVVLSDMAPNASGVKGLDSDRIMRMAVKVKEFTVKHGYMGTSMVIKVWQSGQLSNFVHSLKEEFRTAQLYKPKATRKESGEIYIVAQDLFSCSYNDKSR